MFQVLSAKYMGEILAHYDHVGISLPRPPHKKNTSLLVLRGALGSSRNGEVDQLTPGVARGWVYRLVVIWVRPVTVVELKVGEDAPPENSWFPLLKNATPPEIIRFLARTQVFGQTGKL